MTQQFQADFERVSYLRSQLVNLVEQTVQTVQAAEQQRQSGRLELSRHIKALGKAQDTLARKTLRLLVLGDLKRGKSTLVNALLGEPVLPSDVTPCTALLTVLRFGVTQQVTIHFKDDREPIALDIETFRERYTIDPSEAKRLDAKQQQAFPEVSHAVMDYPLPLLEQGLELIDSPGLNDTETRNQLVLEWMQECHAVIFVFDATQPLTLDERRYLTNYVQGRQLPVFFVVNQWDRLELNVLEGNVAAAHDRIRTLFQSYLVDLDLNETVDDFQSRFFTLSALNVLRSRYKTPDAPIEKEFARFMDALGQFVTQGRFPAELRYTQRCLRGVAQQVTESTEKRIILLGETVQSLEETLNNVQQDFTRLEDIRDQFQSAIRRKRDREVDAIAQSFRDYILGLEASFEEDFVKSQPDLDFLKFLQPESREAFYTGFRRAFERYMNDRLAAWEFMAKQQISRAFEELNAESDEYRVAYGQVVDVINEKLLGGRFYAVQHRYDPSQATLWMDAVKDLFDAIPEQLNYAVNGFNLFWQRVLQTVLAYVCIVIALQIVGLIFSSVALNVFAVLLAGAGVMTVQAELVRQEFLKATHREFAKYLPRIANEQQGEIRKAVEKCFDSYEVEVIDRINMDIAARSGELTNLIEQKQNQSIATEEEIENLKALSRAIQEQARAVEDMQP